MHEKKTPTGYPRPSERGEKISDLPGSNRRHSDVKGIQLQSDALPTELRSDIFSGLII